MKKYKETWTDITWYGSIVNSLSARKYCRVRLGVGAGEPPIAVLILPSQLAYRLVSHCAKINYYNRYYINIDKDSINIDSYLVEVHRDFESWKDIKNIRKLIYG